jgi:hypothetical protein
MAPQPASDAGKNKTTAIAGPRDLLGKLAWEIEALDKAWQESAIVQSYHVFNCAVTAWHLCDWTWSAMDAIQQAAIKSAMPAGTKYPLEKFVQLERDELRICRQIAIGMKHVEVQSYPDAKVTAIAEKSIEILQSTTDPNELKLQHGHGVFVWDSGKPWIASNVFRGAYDYWLAFLDRRAIDVHRNEAG